jgi:YHS domain-containing protein
MKRLFVALVLAACGGSPAPKPVDPTPAPVAEKILVLVDDQGVGLGGHDPVSYTKGGPAAGVAEHASSHGGATYHFASADDKTAFDADQPKFVPGFGGYCAFAAAQNRLSNADPKAFLIHEGQLLVFTNESYKTQFAADPKANKAKADANWPGLVAKHGK